ncbi:hypothetical protein L1987_79531 [Smallanthus sonchifolius]|uniref:Uncharacterized protein n=1 Tax=Smallanthus sonchifolius TaxID=185202 RepID=A0ACB8ZGT3_9ASTR|nr:hypothetical protein L1987_79531 [Smallanthus sonchifolius]
MLLDDASDDHPPELVIMPSEKSKGRGQEDADYRSKTDTELKNMISKHNSYIMSLGHKFWDNGEKLKATVRRCEAELIRRIKIRGDKDDEETIQLSDQTDDGASCRKDGKDQRSLAPSKFANLFNNKFGENPRTVNAFENEMSFINPRQGRKTSQNGQISNRGGSSQQASSRSKQFNCPTTLSDNRKYKISSSDKKVINRSATSSLDRFLTNSMKEVKVYYPSSEDRYPVEVIYTDMECLAPEACLSSTIMNFFIQYLQQSSSENRTCNYHFFNTYFYNKLQKLSYREDSFLKFRKWWNGVNIFEKAFILLPVHQSAHWSLGIICIPTKEDELGPIVLHLDSLGLHDSMIFDQIRRFLKEEWTYLRNSEVPLDLPITDLDHGIINRKFRLTDRDLSMFGKQWFHPEEASNLRVRIHNLLVQEFKIAKDKDAILSPKVLVSTLSLLLYISFVGQNVVNQWCSIKKFDFDFDLFLEIIFVGK